MKTYLLFSLIFILSSFTSSDPQIMNQNTTVIICTGKYATKYHTDPPSSRCRGVKACKGELVRIKLSDAKKKGYSACGYCYH